MSHGNSPKDPNHSITPAERAQILTFIIQEEPEGFGGFLRSLFGDEVSVAEFHQWVIMNCEVQQ